MLRLVSDTAVVAMLVPYSLLSSHLPLWVLALFTQVLRDKGSVWDVATQQSPQEENETTSPLSR